jgi:hypothetical protein
MRSARDEIRVTGGWRRQGKRLGDVGAMIRLESGVLADWRLIGAR